MPTKPATKTIDFYCDWCRLIFRVPEQEFLNGRKFAVPCPQCGRKAHVERLQDGGVAFTHGDHVFICPPPLSHNPPVVVLVYISATLVLATAFAVIAKKIGLVFCPIVFGASLLAIILVGAIQLTHSGQLTEHSFVSLMGIFAKLLPVVLGKTAPKGTAMPESESKVLTTTTAL